MPQKFVYLGIINNRPCAKIYNENMTAMGDNEALCSVPPEDKLIYLDEIDKERRTVGQIFEADYILTVNFQPTNNHLKSEFEKCDMISIFGMLFQKIK